MTFEYWIKGQKDTLGGGVREISQIVFDEGRWQYRRAIKIEFVQPKDTTRWQMEGKYK